MSSDTLTMSKGAEWRLFIPKLVTTLGEGYGLDRAKADLLAGLTVSVVALPLRPPHAAGSRLASRSG